MIKERDPNVVVDLDSMAELLNHRFKDESNLEKLNLLYLYLNLGTGQGDEKNLNIIKDAENVFKEMFKFEEERFEYINFEKTKHLNCLVIESKRMPENIPVYYRLYRHEENEKVSFTWEE